MARGYLKDKEYRMTDIAEFIERNRKREKLSQEEVASRMGHTQSWYSKKLKDCSWDVAELLEPFKIVKAEAEMVGRLFIL